MNMREYKDWRLTGIAYETRLTTNVIPNRTMSSFIPGKKVFQFHVYIMDYSRKKLETALWLEDTGEMS